MKYLHILTVFIFILSIVFINSSSVNENNNDNEEAINLLNIVNSAKVKSWDTVAEAKKLAEERSRNDN